jgi:hypothetical protein
VTRALPTRSIRKQVAAWTANALPQTTAPERGVQPEHEFLLLPASHAAFIQGLYARQPVELGARQARRYRHFLFATRDRYFRRQPWATGKIVYILNRQHGLHFFGFSGGERGGFPSSPDLGGRCGTTQSERDRIEGSEVQGSEVDLLISVVIFA